MEVELDDLPSSQLAVPIYRYSCQHQREHFFSCKNGQITSMSPPNPYDVAESNTSLDLRISQYVMLQMYTYCKETWDFAQSNNFIQYPWP